ncbi:kdo(2)-lipid A phosphoethanolamine 7''-transferase [Ideonella sp. A 288]|uniref:kdo(2)-lipid A phosphoethanolamine 7''-transferase n=1 Tax=Ideonella sp. A 288 TaxID=1962181 RepID=UPI00130373BE|nr:kdo(2)-lipid A phosphoethanolamine 7''-transferase [Ideonella sp. A 288]
MATLLLAAYQALCLNAPEFWERLGAVRDAGGTPGSSALMVAAEAGLVLGVCLLLALLLAALGRAVLLIGGVAMILLSAAASYYMVRYDVVIGYGIVQAVMASDQALSAEMVGRDLLLWVLLLGVLPAVAWWRLCFRRVVRPTSVSTRRVWSIRLAMSVSALSLALASHAVVRHTAEQSAGGKPPVSASGLVAHRYVPTNWLSGMAMTGANRATAAMRANQLSDPAERFTYLERSPLDHVTVVLVIGETTRHDHLGLLGYNRDTTPRLRGEAGLVAFRAESCDTSTRLSLACMFARPEGVVTGAGFEPDRIDEHKVFSVFRELGFSIELFAMQSEVGFYQRVEPDFYKMREVIVADASSSQRQVFDGLLLPEVDSSLDRHPDGRHLIVLHKKGSHYLYSQRYPREFARWQPECLDADDHCGRAELVNAYDNSVLYGDHVLAELFDRLKGRKALVVFTSDHGESIGDGTHFHGTPRAIAPPEQRRVPLPFWGSPLLLSDPVHREAFERLRQRAQSGQLASHQNLFASMLGCLSVESRDGGVTPAHNLCH